MFTSANSVVGNVYSIVSDVDGYFSLKEENTTLISQNQKLINEVETLKNMLTEYRDSASLADNINNRHKKNGYYYYTAKVVNNSVNKLNNYITIDKGTSDGVRSQMGVFNDKGVIGVTYRSSENFSVVMPLLNSKSILSCKVKENTFCTLQWDGKEIMYSYIIDLPRYDIFENGDTVVTSGYSSIFPAGIPVGIIERLEDSTDGQSYRARVRLFVDFEDINNLFVVGNDSKEEQEKLEKSIGK